MRDEDELHRLVTEMPFAPFSDHDVRTFVDPEVGWRQLKAAVSAAWADA